MLLGPMSLSRIHPRIYKLTPMKKREMTRVINAIKVEAADETNVANKTIAMGPARNKAILTMNMESV